MIPTMIPYENDELLISWICRLAEANCFDDYETFIKAYVSNKQVGDYDIKNLDLFIENLPNDYKEKFADVYMKTSLYPYYSLIMTKKTQTKYISIRFRNNSRNSNFSVPDSRKKITHLNVCPVCQKEELNKKGYFYFHRSHQLPGVKVCHRHKCSLVQYTPPINNLFKPDLEGVKIDPVSDLETECKYAKFADDLLQENLELNKKDLVNVIQKEFKSRNIKDYKILKNTLIKDLNLTDKLSSNEYKHISSFHKMPETVETIQDMTIILFSLFNEVKNIPFPSNVSTKEKLLEQLDREGYSLCGNFRETIIALKHKECNTTYITTPDAFFDGWRCPTCDIHKTDTEIFKKIIDETTNHEYDLEGEFKGWYKKSNFVYKKNGIIYSNLPYFFYFQGKRHENPLFLTFKEVQKRVEVHEGFKLIQYDHSTENAKIYSEICGHEFEVRLSNFTTYPTCRVCHPTIVINNIDQFAQELRNLVGDEYAIIGDIKKKGKLQYVNLLHKKCGTEFEISTNSFFNGCRCPQCRSVLTYKRFCKYLSSKTEGIYKCITESKHPRDPVTILNTQTGKSITLTRKKIVQELDRPTPSPILLYDKPSANKNS